MVAGAPDPGQKKEQSVKKLRIAICKLMQESNSFLTEDDDLSQFDQVGGFIASAGLRWIF